MISLQSLDVSVERRSRRVRVGDDVEERITIRNMGALPKPTLEVEDLTDLPGYSSGMAISLESKGFRSWRTQTPAAAEGRLYDGAGSGVKYGRFWDISARKVLLRD